MSDIRKKGIDYVEKHFGKLSSGHITVSQFYDNITKKSWGKGPSWGNEIPLEKLKENKEIHIICEHENGDGFYYFRVPAKDIEDMLKKDELGLKKGSSIILHLSAQPDSLFQDLRGGKIDFSRYLQEKKKD